MEAQHSGVAIFYSPALHTTKDWKRGAGRLQHKDKEMVGLVPGLIGLSYVYVLKNCTVCQKNLQVFHVNKKF